MRAPWAIWESVGREKALGAVADAVNDLRDNPPARASQGEFSSGYAQGYRAALSGTTARILELLKAER